MLSLTVYNLLRNSLEEHLKISGTKKHNHKMKRLQLMASLVYKIQAKVQVIKKLKNYLQENNHQQKRNLLIKNLKTKLQSPMKNFLIFKIFPKFKIIQKKEVLYLLPEQRKHWLCNKMQIKKVKTKLKLVNSILIVITKNHLKSKKLRPIRNRIVQLVNVQHHQKQEIQPKDKN